MTVDRRRKDLQDYSGTASAFSQSQLSALGVQNVKDLSVLVPGLLIGTQESGVTLFVRGIGSDNNTELGDPAVALHVDGVYMPRPRGLGAMFFDIERVEVNSGPQGTLRGRNAVGGTINVVTRQPHLSEFQANAEATFGTYALRVYQGMVNVPIITDKLALRVAGRSEVHDPHWENAGPIHDLRAPQDQNDYALRVIAKYQPVQAFDLTLAYDFLHEGGTGTVGANFQQALTRRDAVGNFIPFDPNDVDDPRRVYMRGTQPSLDTDHQGVRATANLDAGPVLFEATASYRNLDYRQWSGPTNSIAVVPGMNVSAFNSDVFGPTNQWHVTSDSWIGELRAYAPDSERLRWTVGGFYFHEDQGAFLGQINNPVTGSAGGEFNHPSTIGWSMAGFADATFDVVDNFRVLGGIRITHDHKDRENGFWGQWTGLPATDNPDLSAGTGGRFGTEGFRYKGFNRPTYARENDSVEARVEPVPRRHRELRRARRATDRALQRPAHSRDGPAAGAAHSARRMATGAARRALARRCPRGRTSSTSCRRTTRWTATSSTGARASSTTFRRTTCSTPRSAPGTRRRASTTRSPLPQCRCSTRSTDRRAFMRSSSARRICCSSET